MAGNQMTALAILLVAEFALIAQLQGPAPTPMVVSQEKQDLSAAKADDTTSDDGLAETSPPTINKPQTAEADRPGDRKGNPHDGQPPAEGAHITDWIMVFFTGVLTLCTIVQGWFLWQETKSTQVAARAAVDTVAEMQLDRRAWITIHLPTLGPFVAGHTVSCDTPVKNDGRTPGFIIRQSATVVSCLGTEADFDKTMGNFEDGLMESPALDSIVPPNAVTLFHTEVDLGIDAKAIEEITRGERLIFVIAWFMYRDFVGTERISQNCFIYKRQTGALWAYSKHNKMT